MYIYSFFILFNSFQYFKDWKEFICFSTYKDYKLLPYFSNQFCAFS